MAPQRHRFVVVTLLLLLAACSNTSAPTPATQTTSAPTGSVWLLSTSVLRQLDSATGNIRQTVKVGGVALAMSGTSLWVATKEGTVVEVNSADGSVVRTVATGGKSAQIRRLAANDTDVFACDATNGFWRLTVTDSTPKQVELPKFTRCDAVATSAGTVWFTLRNGQDEGLYQLLADGSLKKAFPAKFAADRISIAEGAVYTTCFCEKPGYRYDVAKADGTFIAEGPAFDVAEVGDQIWFGVKNGIARKDRATNTFLKGISLPKEYSWLRLVVSGNSVWAARTALYRIDPTTLTITTVLERTPKPELEITDLVVLP